MIKAIIFDIGGVIALNYKEVMKDFKRLYGIDYAKIDRMRIMRHLQKGLITETQMTDYLISKFKIKGNRKELVDFWTKSYTKHVMYNHDILKLIEKLKRTNKIYCLSDTCSEHLRIHSHLNSVFDESFLSCIVGMVKPNLNFYRYMLKKIKFQPHECIFIDDKPINIEVARKLNMHGILFKSNSQLKRELGKYVKNQRFLSMLRNTSPIE